MSKLLKQIGFATVLGAIAATSPGAGAAWADAGPEGVWRLGNGKLVVRVDYCEGQKICASIVGLKKPLDKQGRPKLDKENPQKSLRSRPIIGLQIISGMKPDGDNRWRGLIYNADDGGTYRATAHLEGNLLEVRGCWGPFCKDLEFKRVGGQKMAQP